MPRPMRSIRLRLKARFIVSSECDCSPSKEQTVWDFQARLPSWVFPSTKPMRQNNLSRRKASSSLSSQFRSPCWRLRVTVLRQKQRRRRALSDAATFYLLLLLQPISRKCSQASSINASVSCAAAVAPH
jgi:hypothetical protein